MALTPLLMIAGEGLLNETALQNPNSGVPTFSGTGIPPAFRGAEDALIAGTPGTPANDVSAGSRTAFLDKMYDNIAFATDRDLPAGVTTLSFSTFLANHLTNLFPTNGQFCVYAQIGMGQKETANKYINSAVNGASLGAQTFTTMDALMSGNLTSVNSDINAWGQELLDTGELFNFNKIDILGTPQGLVDTLMRINMLGAMADEFEEAGMDIFELQKAIKNNPDLALKPVAQKRCYDAFTKVTGEQLTEILFVLQMTTPDIEVLSDLLDLTKVFPTTFGTLTAPDNGTLRGIYLGEGEDVADFVKAFEVETATAMPNIQAKANYAFSLSLQQIKGIINTTATKIGEQAVGIETNEGLSATGNLAEPLPAATSAYLIAEMGGADGSGPDGTFYLTDIVGSAASVPHTENFITMTAALTAFGTTAVDAIAEILTTARDVANGTFDNGGGPDINIVPNTLPAEGFWGTRSLGINALLVELNTIVDPLLASYATEITAANTAYADSTSHVLTEIAQLSEAGIEWEETYTTYNSPQNAGIPEMDGIALDRKATLSFSENLHDFGKKSDRGNIAEILELMATATQGGNAVVAAMREGRNLEKLSEAGVSADNEISDKPSVVEPGNIA